MRWSGRGFLTVLSLIHFRRTGQGTASLPGLSRGKPGVGDMPLYEFRCTACDRVFEELRRAGDEGQALCPVCGKPAPRILSLSAFALKGSGFYATDYGDRRPGSFQRDGKGTIKGASVPIPQLARDPSVPLSEEEAEGDGQSPESGGDAKENA